MKCRTMGCSRRKRQWEYYREIAEVGLTSIAEQYTFTCLMSGQKINAISVLMTLFLTKVCCIALFIENKKSLVKWNRRYSNLKKSRLVLSLSWVDHAFSKGLQKGLFSFDTVPLYPKHRGLTVHLHLELLSKKIILYSDIWVKKKCPHYNHYSMIILGNLMRDEVLGDLWTR